MDDRSEFIIRNNDFIKKINEHNLIPLEIEYENISSRVHLNEFNIDDFLKFAKESNSKYVYYRYTYYNFEDYVIPLDWYDEQVKEVQDAVKDHNNKVNSFDFSMPKSLFMFILQDGIFIGISFYDAWLKNNGIEKAEVTIEAIEDKLYSEVKGYKKLNKANKKEDEKKLREIIFNDPEFKYCRNQELRYYYLVELLEDNEDMMEEYGYLFDPFGAPHIGKAKMFMDKTWMMFQERS